MIGKCHTSKSQGAILASQGTILASSGVFHNHTMASDLGNEEHVDPDANKEEEEREDDNDDGDKEDNTLNFQNREAFLAALELCNWDGCSL